MDHKQVDPALAIVRRQWCELLEIDEAHPDQNFFDLGGDSIMALELATSFEKQTGEELPLAVLLAEGTLSSLEASIASALDSRHG
jgi:acyl carrier protein